MTHARSFAPGFAAMLSIAVFGTGVAYAQKYSATPLPTLAGGTYTTATDINNSEQVVGFADDASANTGAVIWQGGRVTALFPGDPLGSFANGINDAGVVVGEATGGFAWSPSFDYSTGYQVSVATAINVHGELVGAQGGVPAVWTGPSSLGVSFDVPAVPPQHTVFDVSLSALNADGVLVGTVNAASGDNSYHATRWTSAAPNAKVTDLGTLGGRSSQPNAINDRGWIVGWAQLGNGVQHAALWEPTTRAFDLGTLGGRASTATGINIRGDIVGSAQTPAGSWHAVLWTAQHFKAVDLNLEIPPNLARQITLVEAVATNDRCRIVANGIDRRTGADAAFLLVPTNPSTCTGP